MLISIFLLKLFNFMTKLRDFTAVSKGFPELFLSGIVLSYNEAGFHSSRFRGVRWLLRFFIFSCFTSGSVLAQSPQAVISLPVETVVVRSDTGTAIPISLDNTTVGPVAGVQISISFSSGILNILGVEKTARTINFDTVQGNLKKVDNYFIVVIDFGGTANISPGTGPIVHLRVNIPAGTPRGTVIPLQFLRAGANETAIFDVNGDTLSLAVSGGTLKVTYPVTSLGVLPQNPVVEAGKTVQFRGVAAFADGTTDTVTAGATWTSSNTAVAVIDTTGRATALMAGTTVITAILQGTVSPPDTMTVVPDTLPPVLVSGPDVTIDGERNVTIAWETDEPATSVIEFGDTPAYGAVLSDSALVTMHRFTLFSVLSDTLFYRLQSVDPSGNPYVSPPFFFSTAVSVHDPDRQTPRPDRLFLAQNHPNPFNASTMITFQIPQDTGNQVGRPSQVRLTIYNMLGQAVRTLLRDTKDSGTYTLRWNGLDDFGRPVSSGVYLLRLETREFAEIRKILLLR